MIEVGKLSDSINFCKNFINRIDVLRKEVIANVSYELRAPLFLITDYSEMVSDIIGANKEIRNRNMDLIIHEVHRLSEMVDDIMDYSQLQAGYAKLKLETCNLCDLVIAAIEYARNVASQYDLQIDFENDFHEFSVKVDALKMGQILRNLLNNAINHTENGQTIIVSITRDNNNVKIMVTNPGEPIPPEEAELI